MNGPRFILAFVILIGLLSLCTPEYETVSAFGENEGAGIILLILVVIFITTAIVSSENRRFDD